ncbi:hypothetical protein [Alistipes sp.]|uniref:hypothetical protein n=1 Tax=Alistipes sp. TaxID=1872444 RepID=UPI003AB20AFF
MFLYLQTYDSPRQLVAKKHIWNVRINHYAAAIEGSQMLFGVESCGNTAADAFVDGTFQRHDPVFMLLLFRKVVYMG